jgi:hypothetical protein
MPKRRLSVGSADCYFQITSEIAIFVVVQSTIATTITSGGYWVGCVTLA